MDDNMFIRDCLMETYIPSNFRPRSVKGIEESVDYALVVGKNYISQLGIIPGGLKGRTVLEMGPGSDFGPALLLASAGAKVSIIDRFVAEWQDDYHRPLYTELRKRWPGDPGPFDAVLAAGGYHPVITVYDCAIEDMTEDQKFDVIISNAVLEHMRDIKQAVANMARITNPSGWGFHQIDFRDHRDFSRPLEYLLYTDEEFKEKCDEVFAEFGQTYRVSELENIFLQSGFEIEYGQANMFADEEYMAEFLPRLRASSSRYRDWPVDDLRKISAFYRLRTSPRI
ncbi:methyltransferase domain-containing protein [Azospirillum sp. 11R-A]